MMRALRWLLCAAVLAPATAAAAPQPGPADTSVTEDDRLARLTALVAKASSELDAGRIEDAIRDLQAAVNGFGQLTGLGNLDDRIAGLGVAQSLLGYAHARLGRLDAALAALEAALTTFGPLTRTSEDTWARLLAIPVWQDRAGNVLVTFDWYVQVATAAGQWGKAAASLFEAAAFAETLRQWSAQRERLAQLAALYQAHPELPDATANRAWATAGQALALAHEGQPAEALTRIDEASRIIAALPATGEGLRVRAEIEAFAGMVLQGQGRHADAIERLDRAIASFERVPGGRARAVVCLDRLFASHYARNDLPQAIAALRRELDLLAKTSGSELAQYSVYDKLTFVYGLLRNVAEARQAHDRAEQIASRHRVPPERRARAAVNFAVTLRTVGDCKGALDAFERAIHHLEQVPDSASQRASYAIDVAQALTCLQRDPREVDAAIERGLALAPPGKAGDIVRANLRLTAASLAAKRGNRPEVLAAACRRVVAELGDQPDAAGLVMRCQVDLGHEDHRAGRHEEALRRYRAASALSKRLHGDQATTDRIERDPGNTDERVTLLLNEATALTAAGRYPQAMQALEDIAALEAPARIGNLLQMGVFDRHRYMGSEGASGVAGKALVALSFLASQVDARSGLTSVLVQKAMFSEIGRIANQAILDSGPGVSSDWQQQIALRQRVAGVVHAWQGPRHEVPASEIDNVIALFKASDAVEQRALARAADRLGVAAWRGPMLAALIARLKPSDALVEIVRFDPIDLIRVKRDVDGLVAKASPAHYGAFVVSGRGRAVQAIDLGAARPIDDAVDAYRTTLEQQIAGRARFDEAALARQGTALRKLVVDPLLGALGKVKRLYVSPDGQIAVVPLEALPVDGPGAIRYFGEDVEVIYLSSGRDLARPAAAPATREAWLVGDPAFDASAAELATRVGARQRGLSTPAARPATAPSAPWRALPETRPLLDAMGAVAVGAGLEAHFLDGAGASEGNVLRIRRPRLLVLASHGTFNRSAPTIHFTFTELEVGPSGTRMEGFSEHSLRAADPLIRSAIALAGANRSGASPRKTPIRTDGAVIEAGDGVLTAYEVWGMDLRGTELVALGACESGLGVVEAGSDTGLAQPPGEVVAGLRQAFMVAGARSIVMSMWRVPVDETAAQLKQFFDGWLGRGVPRYRAFREAQLAALAQARRMHHGGHPFWWAGFVYTGDSGE